MHPVLFEIPGLGIPIRSFGVLVAAGFLLAIQLWSRLLARYGEDPEHDPDRGAGVAMWILLGVLGGGRLLYVIVEIAKYLALDEPTGREIGAQFLAEPQRIVAVWEGGLVMFGGFFGAIVLGVSAAKRAGLNPWNALDTGLAAAFVGQAIGRVGCLLVGDDYGSVVPEAYAGLPFPFVIHVPSLEWLQANPESLFDHSLAGATLWATQPWMTINALIIAFVAHKLLPRRRYFGQVSQWILVHYAVTRFGIEAFRGDSVRGVWDVGLSTSQLIAIPCALVGIWLLWKNRRRTDLVRAGAAE